jgi:hypothetical protein
MKPLVLILLSALLVANACEKEETLKETIGLTIVNKTDKDYLNARLFVLAADAETHSDSLLIEIPADDSVRINWNPKLSSSSGSFYFVLDNKYGLDYFELDNKHGLALWYYDGYSIADDGPFKLIIEENEIIYK